MKLSIDEKQPCFCRVTGTDQEIERLKNSLTYVNTSMQFQYRKFKKSAYWYADKYGQDAFEAKCQELKEASKKSLLSKDDNGYLFPSGVCKKVSSEFNVSVVNNVSYPKKKLLPWQKQPPTLRDYQNKMVENLLENKHAAVSAATGVGKSLCILKLCKDIGLKTIVMAPSASITNQLYEQFVEFFGKKYVGLFTGQKKQTNKLFTIGTAASLTRIEEGTPQWEDLSSAEVFISDESHQTAAATLASVCFGLAAKAPYRFFFSATQVRSDGQELLLDSIIGPIVFEMDVSDGTEIGVLAKPKFRTIKIQSSIEYIPNDPNECTRKHLYYNPQVVEKVAEIVNNSVSAGLPTVVLIKEIEQFGKLLPYLKHECDFAFGGLTDQNKSTIPQQYWDKEPDALVERFNSGESKLLVGTSCISTGTDIRPLKVLIYWQGGKSEVQVKQAIGRGTRVVPGKTEFYVFDFDVYNIPTLHRHYKSRAEFYNELSPPVMEIMV